MKISHEYTADEVDGLMPSGTSAEVITAVKSIYTGLSSKSLSLVTIATEEKASKKVDVTFDDSNNPKDNINKDYDLLAKGLKRATTATRCWQANRGSKAR